jgi:hypothetical protein
MKDRIKFKKNEYFIEEFKFLKSELITTILYFADNFDVFLRNSKPTDVFNIKIILEKVKK